MRAIFSDPSLKLVQVSFAAFRFFLTSRTPFALSLPPISLFAPGRITLGKTLPSASAASKPSPSCRSAGWPLGGGASDRALVGLVVAVAGTVTYSVVIPRERKRQGRAREGETSLLP